MASSATIQFLKTREGREKGFTEELCEFESEALRESNQFVHRNRTVVDGLSLYVQHSAMRLVSITPLCRSSICKAADQI